MIQGCFKKMVSRRTAGWVGEMTQVGDITQSQD
jgi:hypothetical protein